MRDIHSWLKYDWDRRKQYAVSLLKGLRLGRVPLDKVKEIIDASMLQQLPECREILDDLERNMQEFADVTDSAKLPESFLPRNMIKVLLIYICTMPVTV